VPDLNTEPTKRATVTFKEGAVDPYFTNYYKVQ